MSIKTHLTGAFGFNIFLDLAYFFVEDIWHDVKIGSGSISSSIPSQTFTVSTAINYLVDLCPNLWCNNSESTFFLGAIFYDLDFSLVFTKDSCFLYAKYGRGTTF